MADNANKKILIVDDERDMSYFLGVRLRSQGYTVATAKDGLEALETIKTDQPDLILLDIMMPKMSGYEVCRTLKQSETTKHIPVIFLTARDQAQDRAAALSSGGDDFLAKPFESQALLMKITTWIK